MLSRKQTGAVITVTIAFGFVVIMGAVRAQSRANMPAPKENVLYCVQHMPGTDMDGNVLLLSEDGMRATYNMGEVIQELPAMFVIRNGEIHAVTGSMIRVSTEPLETEQ